MNFFSRQQKERIVLQFCHVGYTYYADTFCYQLRENVGKGEPRSKKKN